MSDIFKPIPCANCGNEFDHKDLQRVGKKWYCMECIEQVNPGGYKGQDQSAGMAGEKKHADQTLDGELQLTNKKVQALEGKITELEDVINSVSSATSSVTVEIASALKNIAQQIKQVAETSLPPIQNPTKLKSHVLERSAGASRLPALPNPEFQLPSESEVISLIQTPAIFNWGGVVDLVVRCGWHRSYHTFLAFLRAVDTYYSDIIRREYKGKPGETGPTPGKEKVSLYAAWVSSVGNHLPLLREKCLKWRDFSEPQGSGKKRNAQARWQQKVLDYLISRENISLSSHDIAEALLPAFPSASSENVKRRMLQNVVANLVRRGVLALKDPKAFPKEFWIPDNRVDVNNLL